MPAVHRLKFNYKMNGQLFCEFYSLIFVVVVLLFYVQGKHLRSCRDGQLT